MNEINFGSNRSDLNFASCFLQKDNEKNHKVRIAIGNGVRTDIWSEFLNRFGDIKVRELYAATEGNIGFINYTSKLGAVGRVNIVHRVSGASGVLGLRRMTPQWPF